MKIERPLLAATVVCAGAVFVASRFPRTIQLSYPLGIGAAGFGVATAMTFTAQPLKPKEPLMDVNEELRKPLHNLKITRDFEECVEAMIGTTRLVALYGDITKQTEVMVTVNAANPSLKLTGMSGIAAAFCRADTDSAVEQECLERGPIQHGEAALTGAGKLAEGELQHIIHAAGPRFDKEAVDTSVDQLYSAYTMALDLATKAGDTSIAFPYLSSGIFAFPVEEGVVRIPLRAVQDYVAEHPNAFTEIRFIGFKARRGERSKVHQALLAEMRTASAKK